MRSVFPKSGEQQNWLFLQFHVISQNRGALWQMEMSLFRPNWYAVVFMTNPKKLCITFMRTFHDYWADPIVHLLLLKSSMSKL